MDFPSLAISWFEKKSTFPNTTLPSITYCEFLLHGTREYRSTGMAGMLGKKEVSSILNSQEPKSRSFFLTCNLQKGSISSQFRPSLDTVYDFCRLQSPALSFEYNFRVVGEVSLSTQRPPVLSCSTPGSAGSFLPHGGAG